MKRAVGRGFIILLYILVFLILALLVVALQDVSAQAGLPTAMPDALCRTEPSIIIRHTCTDGEQLVVYACETFQPVPNHVVFWDDVIACEMEADEMRQPEPVWARFFHLVRVRSGQDQNVLTPTPAPTMCAGWWERGVCDPTATPIVIVIGPTPTP